MDTTTATATATASSIASPTAATADVSDGCAKVQHVTKKSSDELLRKFAELDDDDDYDEKKKMAKRRRRSKIRKRDSQGDQSPSHQQHYGSSALVESQRRSLLPTVARKSVLLRQLGIGRSHLIRANRDIIRNKSILGNIGKTWHKTLEGASRVLLEKRYNRHRRLINDVV